MFRALLQFSLLLWALIGSLLLLMLWAAPQLAGDEQVIYAASIAGKRQLFIADLQRGLHAAFYASPGNHAQPSTAPRSGAVVFVDDRDGESELYLLPRGAKQARQLTKNTHQDLNPQWSPDESRIVYQANPQGIFQLFLIDPQQPAPQHIGGRAAAMSGPSWSPDGSAIAYDSGGEIHLYDLESDSHHALTDDDFWDKQPVWSPDGASIVYESRRGRSWNLHQVELAGNQTKALLRLDYNQQNPTFTNRAGQIAFQSTRQFPGRLYLLDLHPAPQVRERALPPPIGSPLYLLFGITAVLQPNWTDILEPDWLR